MRKFNAFACGCCFTGLVLAIKDGSLGWAIFQTGMMIINALFAWPELIEKLAKESRGR